MISTVFKVAFSKPVVVKSLLYMATIGPVLIAINHYDLFMNQEVDSSRIAKMIITPVVPYLVCTLSTVQSELRNNSKP